MAPKASEFDREMNQLEAELKRLEAEYTMFFAGRLPRLPWETRARVDKLVKRYDRMNLQNTAQKFRFGTIQARFMTFCELWERSLRAKEEGRPQPGARPAMPPNTDTTAAEDAGQPPASHRPRILHVSAIRDATRDTEALMSLYERLSEARREAGQEPLPYKNFANVVKAQLTKHGGGGTEVGFRVSVQDGKVVLTAKALSR